MDPAWATVLLGDGRSLDVIYNDTHMLEWGFSVRVACGALPGYDPGGAAKREGLKRG